MSRRERQRSFFVAVIAVVAAIAAVSALGGTGDDDKPRAGTPIGTGPTPPDVRPPLPDRGARASEDHAAGSLHPATRRERAAARRFARRFIAAFARYQAGDIDQSAIRTLRALTTPELAAYLLAQPPRGRSPTSTPPRIVRLDLAGPAHGPLKAAALLAYGDEPTSLFELALRRSGARWRVAELYPSGD